MARLQNPSGRGKHPHECSSEAVLLLDLRDCKQIGAGEAAAFAGALKAGAAPKCTWLELRETQVGDAGLAALTEALGRGAMPGLEKIDVKYSEASKAGRAAVRKVRRGVKVSI